ncbi:alpha/beta hydrolase [Spirillospora sp. NPDC047279]|uniref:alpha/beta fold hydrolase n=1 Tax=Spirillospora sp. NPDC047279 TaxID=3155478 RepID=UPI0033DDE2CD
MEPPLGRRYEVAGRGLMLHRSGAGGPAVVFLPGAGLVGLDFLNVQRRAAEFTTGVLYDRAGTGWSDEADLPRTPGQVARELRDLLRAADVPGPFVLAGHSLGAFYARRYAQLFPEEVAGLLLLDPGHEDILTFMPPRVAEINERMKEPPADLTDEQLTAARVAFGRLYAEWPDEVREPLIDHGLAAYRTGTRETENFETEVYDELRGGGPLPDVPLIVLSAQAENPYWKRFMSADELGEAHEGLRRMHAALAASVPRGELRPLPGASHQYLHVERPDAVVEAIRDLLGG